MNRLFNRGRNYKMLSLLMVFVMLFSLLPSSIVNAEAQTVATATILVAESGNGFINDADVAGKVVYDPNGAPLGKLRARVEFPADYVPTLGDVITISYETNISSLSAEFGYDYNSSNARTMASDQTSITFSLDEKDLAYFAGNTSGYEAAIRFKQSDCPEGSYLAVSSVTVTRDVAVDNQEGNNSGNVTDDETTGGNVNADSDNQVAWGVEGGPTITLDTDSNGFTFVSNDDGSVTVSYPSNIGWEKLKFRVENSNISKYSSMQIDFTPSWEGMNMGVYYGSDVTLVSAWGAGVVKSPDRQTRKINLTTDLTEFYFYIDMDASASPLPTESTLSFTIHNIKIVDPNASVTPEEPKWGVEGGPVVTIDMNSEGYTCVANDDGSVTVTYPSDIGWEKLKFEVENSNISKYSSMQIDFTPSWEGMNMGVYYGSDVTLVSAWGAGVVKSPDRQTRKINLTTDLTEFYFYIDMDASASPLPTESTLSFTIHSIKIVDPNAPVEPQGPTGVKVLEMPLSNEGKSYETMSEDGKTITMTEKSDFRARVVFPDDFRVEAGKVLTINYDTSISGLKAYFSWGSGTEKIVKDLSTTEKSLVIVIDEQFVEFFNNNTSSEDTMIRFKFNGAEANTYFTVNSVTYGDSVKEEENQEPVIPSWQVNDGPTVTLDTNSDVFSCNVNEDKSVDVSFTAPAGWTALRANVENCDYTKYSRVKIDITPAEGLYLYVYGDVDGDISGKYDFDSTKRTTIEFDLTRDTKYFDLWCNPQDGMGTAGQKDFTIHSIKIVDPTMPEGEKVNAVLSVQEGNFTQTAPDTISGTAKTKMRGKIELPLDFRVEEGKILTIGYETNIPDITVELAYGYEGFNDAMNVTLDTDKNSFAYTIDANWIKYINAKENGKVPTLRLKQNEIPADGYFKLKYVIYGDAPVEKYNPEQVPQGLVVTYYNDIYSRGVAWNTDNTVEENALYYVKATDGMTAETVDWTSSDVQKVEATSKDTTDTTGKTWRTFKAHVENLDAGAKYFYRAGNEATGWSEVGSFTIEKAKEEITGLSFIHVTDSQEESSAGFQKWARVLKEAYTRDPNVAFVAHTGDIVNRSENVNNFYMSEWMYAFDEPMSQIMNGVFAPASGNHETLDYVFTERFDIQWADYKEGDEELKYGGCYTVTYGEPENGLVLISLNNTAEAWNYDTDFKLYQQVWLVEQLEKYNDYKWKVVQLHEGLMTAGNHTNDGEVDTMRDMLPPIFAKYKVDLVLQGHDHVYTRTRSYAYGENVFEPGTEENPNYFNGHTPVWTETQTLEPGETSADGSVTNNLDRTIYLEPQGTHYITINSCGTKQYPEEPAEKIDEVIFEGDNPINPTDENGKYGSMCQPGLPMYGIVSIEGDLLIYDSYTYDHNSRTSDLYDSFAVSKANKSGYNTDNPHEGKEEVQLYGIKMESKTYDGYAPKLDISGFIASDPRVMDVTAFKYTITSDGDDGASYNQSARGELFYGSNGKGIIPTQKGDYVLTVEIPQSNRYFYGSTTVKFSIK